MTTPFYAPIGTPEERRSGQIWPGEWLDATGYAVRYRIDTEFEAYHTGVDLNLNSPIWDADAHDPVFAIGDGVVTYAGYFSSGWGNLIIIDHGPVDGLPLYARYAHVESIYVKVGERVTAERQIAHVGRINDNSPFHLHFDLSRTHVLKDNPGHWPKLNLQGVLTNYVDPRAWLLAHGEGEIIQVPPREWQVTATIGLKVREQPTTSARQVGSLRYGDIFIAEERKVIANSYEWMRISSGPMFGSWVAKGTADGATRYAKPVDEPAPVPGLPVGTALYVIAPDGLRLRDKPSTSGNRIAGLPKGTKLTTTGVLVIADTYDWYPVADGQSGYAAFGKADKSAIYLGTKPPKVEPPPQRDLWRGGLHIHEINLRNNIIAAAQAGMFQSVTVINDWQLANILIQWVPYVILRRARSTSDPQPQISGNPERDYEYAKQWIRDPFHWDIFPHADDRVYLQFANEQNGDEEGGFYIGLVDELWRMGLQGIILNHAIGTTGLDYTPAGKPVCPKWMRLKDCLINTKRRKMLVGMHLYGNVKDTILHPLSAYDDLGAAPWYRDSVFACYSLMPPEAQPDLVITEAGPGKSELQRQTGIDACWKDWTLFNQVASRYGYLVAWNWWEAGAMNPDYGFPGDYIDDWLPELVRRWQAIYARRLIAA